MRTPFLILTASLGCVLIATPVWVQTKSDPNAADRKGGEVVEVEIAKGVVMHFCWIPPGEAQLGSPKAERQKVKKTIGYKWYEWEPKWLAAEAEEVRGKFRTRGFWLAKFPVTQEQWQAVMTSNPSEFQPTREEIKKAGITDTSRFPVESVSWEKCCTFLEKLNAQAKVLDGMGRGRFVAPHEDEWEYACRGGKGNKQAFYFGDRLNGDLANSNGDHPYGTDKQGPWKERTTAVGEYEKVAPHPWGLCDMHGNVGQWCENPDQGDKDTCVVRGGSYFFAAYVCRSASRDWWGRDNPMGHRTIGLRVCFRPD